MSYVPPLPSVAAAFARSVLRHGERTAITDGDRSLSYAALAARADALAAALRARDIGPGSRVGLFAPRSLEAIVGMLATVRAGAAYVPLDPTYPAKLLQFQCEDSAPSLLLHQGSAPFWHGPAIELTAPLPATATPSPPETGPDDPIYLMYTSGSTGRPKGVLVPHRGVLRLVLEPDYVELGPEERILQLAPLAFDASTFEIWGALLNGGTLVIESNPMPSLDDIAAIIERERISTAWLTAGVFHLMVEHRLEGLRPLRQLLAGGDVLSPPHVARALQALPARLINGYGPTENTTFSCCYTVPRTYDGHAPLPIGRPIHATRALVLDEDGAPVGIGATGELYVGGAGVALGYWGQPALTAERFVADPAQVGARLYRTGDRVSVGADGNLSFHGRADRQVKINGKRVELDEIEARLLASGLVSAVAVLSPAGPERRIHAFVTPKPGVTGLDSALRERLRAELPDYMMPATLQVRAELPLSPTGKVDRRALETQFTPSSSPATLCSTTDAPPMPAPGEMQPALARLWSGALGRADVGPDDNFFDMGGTSLQLLRLHASISAWDRSLSVVDMFQHPTIRALAARLTRTEPAASASPGALSAAERAQRQRAALARRPTRQGLK